jgi:hypothetical protein
MKRETKPCFTCKMELELTEYAVNNRLYKNASQKGVVYVCKMCEFRKAIKDLSNVRYNFETSKFEVNHFADLNELVNWYKEKGEL